MKPKIPKNLSITHLKPKYAKSLKKPYYPTRSKKLIPKNIFLLPKIIPKYYLIFLTSYSSGSIISFPNNLWYISTFLFLFTTA
jgi:hypothetical protein